MWPFYSCLCFHGKSKGSSYIAQYPVLRTVQSALHFTSLTDLFTQTPSRLLWEASSHMLQLMREGCSYTYPPLSIARYSFNSAEWTGAMCRTKLDSPSLQSLLSVSVELGLVFLSVSVNLTSSVSTVSLCTIPSLSLSFNPTASVSTLSLCSTWPWSFFLFLCHSYLISLYSQSLFHSFTLCFSVSFSIPLHQSLDTVSISARHSDETL